MNKEKEAPQTGPPESFAPETPEQLEKFQQMRQLAETLGKAIREANPGADKKN